MTDSKKKKAVKVKQAISCAYIGEVRVDLKTCGSDVTIRTVEMPATEYTDRMDISVEDCVATFKSMFPCYLGIDEVGCKIKEKVTAWLLSSCLGMLSSKVEHKCIGEK